MPHCIFCKIIKGELPGTIVEISEHWLSLLPIDQVSTGHTLLIPKNHYHNIFDLGYKGNQGARNCSTETIKRTDPTKKYTSIKYIKCKRSRRAAISISFPYSPCS